MRNFMVYELKKNLLWQTLKMLLQSFDFKEVRKELDILHYSEAMAANPMTFREEEIYRGKIEKVDWLTSAT